MAGPSRYLQSSACCQGRPLKGEQPVKKEKPAKKERPAKKEQPAEKEEAAQSKKTASQLRATMFKEVDRIKREQLDLPKSWKRDRKLRPPSRKSTPEQEAQDNAESTEEYDAVRDVLDQMDFEHLPPRSDWKKEFQHSSSFQSLHRYFVSNRNTIRDMVAALELDSAERKGEKVTILEGYPGPGTIISELLKLPQVEKAILLEDVKVYESALHDFQEKLTEKGEGGRLDLVRTSIFMWESYNLVLQQGCLAHLQNRVAKSDGTFIDFCDDTVPPPDHKDLSWKTLSPLLLIAQLPNTVYGEQLFAQIVRAITTRSWFFRLGRIKMAFVCGEALAKRVMAQAGDPINRCKLGTTVQCLADVEMHKLPDDLRPHAHHFFPSIMNVGPRVPVSNSYIANTNAGSKRTRNGMAMMTITPRVTPLITGDVMDAFEFLARSLFVLRAQPVGEALAHVAPSGANILKRTGQQQVDEGLISSEEIVLPHELVSNLTNMQWSCLARTFEKWPFRPKNLLGDTPMFTRRQA